MAAFKFDPSSINAGLNNLDFSGMDLSGAVGNVQLDLSSLDLSQMPAIGLNGLDAPSLITHPCRNSFRNWPTLT